MFAVPYFLVRECFDLGVILALCILCEQGLRPNSHRARMHNASKWDLLLSMGVFTLHANNIKGKMFQFAVHVGHVASCVLCELGPLHTGH